MGVSGIVVTVDMLSTGVDIPNLEFIVLMRPVKSRILNISLTLILLSLSSAASAVELQSIRVSQSPDQTQLVMPCWY